MFGEISDVMWQRMKYLEEIDARDREDGTERMKRLRQIPPETGRFLAITAAASPAGMMIEIGTSAGYSTMWLSLAARETGRRVITHELLEEKIAMARETFRLSGIEDLVELVEGDVLEHLPGSEQIGFCFLDTEKEIYEACWDIVADRLVPGGILAADNAINHYETIKPMIDKVEADDRFDSLVVPVGKGVLLARRKSAA